ncbi:small integral membrane protein 14 [Fopius arisanus]|uniref:Small integral membrane protein 14 n=1 Tax=Fopius arisanus TaxID=64838 RepID=A0A0C9QWA1_9HYME|nr:PREDICTED: small integral membrane protein 14 [Fopius arisanus]
MGDEKFDMCEYVWNYDAMQRLISLLRQSQAYCTDNECLNFARLPGPPTNQPSSDFLFMSLAVMTILLLYVLRPNSLKQNSDEKSRHNPSRRNDDPPAPPPPAIH